MFGLGAFGGFVMAALVWVLGYRWFPRHSSSHGYIDLGQLFKLVARILVAGSVVTVLALTGLSAFGLHVGGGAGALQFQLGILVTYVVGVAVYFVYRYKLTGK